MAVNIVPGQLIRELIASYIDGKELQVPVKWIRDYDVVVQM